MINWGTPLGVPQYWFDQTWGKRAIIEGDNFFAINREVALSARIDNDNDNENMFITTDIYSISETNARHKYIGKSIKQ